MVDERLGRLSAILDAADTAPSQEAEGFLVAGTRMRDELLSVAHEPKAEGAHLIDQREMKSWLRHANRVLASPQGSILEAMSPRVRRNRATSAPRGK